MANEPPCGCIVGEKPGEYYIDGCDCMNTGDTIAAASWCARENEREVCAVITENARNAPKGTLATVNGDLELAAALIRARSE